MDTCQLLKMGYFGIFQRCLFSYILDWTMDLHKNITIQCCQNWRDGWINKITSWN